MCWGEIWRDMILYIFNTMFPNKWLVTHSGLNQMVIILQIGKTPLFKISMKFVSWGLTNGKRRLIQIMACSRTGKKMTPDPRQWLNESLVFIIIVICKRLSLAQCQLSVYSNPGLLSVLLVRTNSKLNFSKIRIFIMMNLFQNISWHKLPCLLKSQSVNGS